MNKTDRQTDNRGYWWSITAFNDEIQICEDNRLWPHFIKNIYGGREQCPTTGTIHFQGAIECKSQQRFAAIKKFLPTAHIELAIKSEALKKYVMKEDTAIGEKTVLENRRHMSMADALTVIGLFNMSVDVNEYIEEFNCKDLDEGLKRMYWDAVRHHLEHVCPEDVSLFTQPQMISAWKNTHRVWVKRAIVLQPAPELSELEIATPAVPLQNNMSDLSIEQDGPNETS